MSTIQQITWNANERGKDTELTAFSMLEKCCILLDRIFCIWISEAIAVPWNSCDNQYLSAHKEVIRKLKVGNQPLQHPQQPTQPR